MAETSLAQFGHEFQERCGFGAQMGIYDLSGLGRRPVNLLWPVAVIEALVVREAEKYAALEFVFLGLGKAAFEAGVVLFGASLEIAIALGWWQSAEKLLRGNVCGLAAEHPVIVHGHQPEKNFSVFDRIVGGGQKEAQNRGAAKDQRFASPSFAQTRERLTLDGFALNVALLRHL